MKNLWHNQNYVVWQFDLSSFIQKHLFDKELENKFNISSTLPYPPESNGNAFSTDISDISYFMDFYNLIYEQTTEKLLELSNQKIKKLRRVWANRMLKGSFGSIHKHGADVKVLIIYYNIPHEHASDLVIINPKYKLFNILDPKLVPEIDRFHIKVQNGLCILHGGEILHAVSEHKSDLPRDCIIFEFETVNKE